VRAGKNVIDKFMRFWQRVSRLRKLKRQHGIDICISHLEGADLVNIFSRAGEKTISWVHGSKRFDGNITGVIGSLRQKLIIPLIYSRSDLVVTVSDAIRQELIDHYEINPARIQTVYNFFDTTAIWNKAAVPLGQEFEALFQHKKTLLFSGRLAAQKNLIELLRWFSLFENHTCSLIILGDGKQRNELLEICASLGISAYHPWTNMNLNAGYRVYFLGFQENPYPFVKRADLFILPSLWEGFPMALGEAMACGTPVASADCPTGPREMLKVDGDRTEEYPDYGQFGVLLPLLNPTSYQVWSKCIQRLLEDQSMLKRYREQSLVRAKDFNLVTNSNKILSLVRNLLIKNKD
jgi:glycosyltransferase involved in cell wall biosynthesis